MDAKRDIFAMQDLFGPRDRGIPASNRVAFLVSQPTERLGVVAGHGNHVFSKANALAMAHDAHLPLDAVFEEDLAEFDFHRTPYRFLVAAGIDATRWHDAFDPRILESWTQKDGGTLALLQEAMELDEYGRPVGYARDRFPGIALGEPCKAEAQSFEFRGASYAAVPYREVSFATNANWEVLASLPDGHPAIARRKIGKGKVYYVGVRFPTPGDEGRLIAALAADRSIFPTCETQDPATRSPVDGIEVQAARGADGDVGFVVCNRTLAAKAVRFLPRGAFAPVAALLDVSRNVVLAPDSDGAFLLLLDPDVPVVLRRHPKPAKPAAASNNQ